MNCYLTKRDCFKMSKGIFCVECGNEYAIFKEGVCINCYLKTHSFTKGPEIIDIPICTNCMSYKIKNIWTLLKLEI